MLSKKRLYLNKITEYFFYFYLFLLPWQTRYIIEQGYLNGPWEYGTYSLYAIDIILLLIFVFSWFYKKNDAVETRLIASLRNNSIILFSLFLLISFLSIYWSNNEELSFYYWLRLLGAMVFVYLLNRLNLDFKKISFSLIFAGLLQAVLGLVQFFSQKVLACKWLGISFHSPEILGDSVVENATCRFLRAYGSLPHPNILGGFLVICLVLLIFLLLQNKNKYQRIILFICLPIITSGLFFSFSRAALASLFISWLFAWLFLQWQHKILLKQFFKITALLALVFMTLTLIYPDLVVSRATQINRLEKKSIAERATLQAQSLFLIEKTWPTGIGIGNYTQAVYDKIDDNLESYDYQPVHNVYLLVFAEIGLFGFLVFLLMLINALKNINISNLESAFLGVYLISLIIIGFFDHYLLTLNFGLLFFFLPIGLLLKTCGKPLS